MELVALTGDTKSCTQQFPLVRSTPPSRNKVGVALKILRVGRYTNFKNMPDSTGFLSKVMEATNACQGGGRNSFS